MCKRGGALPLCASMWMKMWSFNCCYVYFFWEAGDYNRSLPLIDSFVKKNLLHITEKEKHFLFNLTLTQ